MSHDLYRERVRRREILPSPELTGPRGAPAFVGRVTTATPAAGKFVLVNPVQVLGTEGEGNSGSLAVDTGTSVPVLLVGPGAPATGDDLVCRFVDHRWVASRKAAPTGTIACTNCPGVLYPATLYATVDGTTYAAVWDTFSGAWRFSVPFTPSVTCGTPVTSISVQIQCPDSLGRWRMIALTSSLCSFYNDGTGHATWSVGCPGQTSTSNPGFSVQTASGPCPTGSLSLSFTAPATWTILGGSWPLTPPWSGTIPVTS